MELRVFAEHVLFATDLETKLASPSEITDEAPGPAIASPETPGRPCELRFRESRAEQPRFPKLQQLDHPSERGRLFHFFANHELLAVELMALVLLRFPGAPASFRRGVFQTLRDEQEHTRLYLARMKACGVVFGELPVSGFFWRAVSGMQSPVDYVAGLSLTFEQANLDFSRQFAQGFRTVGDVDSAGLLDRIYHDEIAHVAYGLKWFRRWKAKGESDWDAFCRQLKLPLSPQRAKGLAVNVEGRRAAGFDSDFIARLEVYSQSKGRTPNVFLFNPFTEGFLRDGPSFAPGRTQAALALDLAPLPMFSGHSDDIVIVPEIPRLEFLAGLKRAGLPVPEFVVAHDADSANKPGRPLRSLAPSDPRSSGRHVFPQLDGRKLGSLRPWAWGPDSLDDLAPLEPAVTGDPVRLAGHYSSEIAELYSKAWSAAFLRDFLVAHDVAWLCPVGMVGTAVTNRAEASEAVARIRSGGHHRVVVKEAFGLAGGNAIRLWEPEMTEAQARWIAAALEKGSTLIVEPWLDREFDFSIQLERRASGLELRGYTGLVTDARGQFLANRAGADHRFRLPARVVELLRDPSRPADLPHRLQQDILDLVDALERRLRPTGFLGPLGIDAFVYRTAAGTCQLKPVVEINPRYTMGRVTLELMRFVASGSCGLFRLIPRSRLAAEGAPDFRSLAAALEARYPSRFEGSPIPRLREGAVVLNDPVVARAVLAVFHVARSVGELPDPSGTARSSLP